MCVHASTNNEQANHFASFAVKASKVERRLCSCGEIRERRNLVTDQR